MNSPMLDNYRESLSQRRNLEVSLQHAREDLKARQLYLTPTGAAWKELGTSEDDRKTALAKAFTGDTACIDLTATIRKLEIELANVAAIIDQAEAQRRDEEWAITRALAEALQWRRNAGNPGREAAQFAGLCQAQQEAALQLLGEQPPTEGDKEAESFVVPF